MNEIYNRDSVNNGLILNRKKSWRWLSWVSLCLMFLMGTSVFAQISAYTFAQSSGTYSPISGGTIAASGASLDDGIVNITLPTPFSYNGNNITNVGFSANGYLIMGATATHGYTPISSSATSKGVVAALAADLNGISATTEMRWEQIGSEIIFQWKDFRRYNLATENVGFQIRLNTTTKDISIVYNGSSTVNSAVGTPMVGLRGTTNADYNSRRLTTSVPDATPSWDDTAASTSNAHNVRFTSTAIAAFPAAGQTFTWSAPVIAIDMASTAVLGVPVSGCTNSAVPLSVRITNNGANAIDFSINNAAISVAITGASTQTLSASVTSGTLAIGASQDVLVSPNADFSVAGTHNLAATVLVAGDGLAGNNTFSTSKLIVVPTVVSEPFTEGFATTSTPANWSTTGWTIASTHGVTSNGIYKNIFGSAPTGQFSTVHVGAISATSELKFDYRIVDYTSYPATARAAGWGNFKVQVSTDCGGTFSDLQTINDVNHITSTNWANKTISLASYVGQNVQVRILATWVAGDYFLDFDNFSIAPIPVLPPNCATGHSPIDLATDVVRNSSLTWSAATGSPLSYDVYFGTSTSPALVTNVTGTSYTPATMAANTTYYWKVISKNNNGDAVGCIERSFTTGSTVNYCPSVPTSNDGSGITSVTLGSTTFPVTDVNYYSYPTTIDFAAGTSNTTSISFATGYEYTTYIWIDLNDNGVFETSELLYEGLSTDNNPTILNASFLLSESAPLGVHKMRIGTSDGGQSPPNPCYSGSYGVTIDAMINVTAAPACLAPTALLSSEITSTTATLSWTASASTPANGYDVYYSTTNTAPVALTTPTVENHTASPINITGLSAASAYYWWVRSDCGGETSAWALGGSFTTLCEVLIAPTAIQDFETFNGAAPSPACWTEATGTLALNSILSGTTSGWSLKSNGFANVSAANKGFSINLYGTTNEWMISPAIDLSSTAGLYRLKYRYAVTGYNGTSVQSTLGTHKVNVVISTDGGTTWSNANSIKTYTGVGTYSNAGAFETINLTGYSGVVKIAFVASTTSTSPDIDFHVDDFSVELTPCPSGIWTGATDTSWSTAGNWDDNVVPADCSDVTINSANPVLIGADVTVASITLGATANVTVNGSLTVGNITVATGGMMTVANDAAVLQTDLAENSGMITVKRNSYELYRQDYTLWSSPVGGQNLRAFSTQTLFNRFSSYDSSIGANGNYVQEITNAADAGSKTFGTAKGYLIRMPNNWVQITNITPPPAESYLGSFTGTLNNGPVSVALSGANNKLNLVGNPYASPISIASFFAANTNIDETLYFWRKQGSELSGASGYATYTSLGMVSADPSINNSSPTNIEVGQGFFVIANSVSPGNLVFNNTMRNNGAATFYKGATETPNELHRMWLSLSNATTVVGQTLIGYATGATQGVDAGIDAAYFNDSDLALTSLINNNEYIIQGRSLPFADSDIVPLGFKSDVSGNYTIALSNFDGLFAENQDIFLKDNVTGTIQNLKLASYTFATPVGVHNTRFEVQYTNSTLGTNNPLSGNNSILIGVKDQKITINAGTKVMEKVEVIDVAGRVIFTQDAVNATSTILENVVSENQMLIVRISTKENGVVTQKIIF